MPRNSLVTAVAQKETSDRLRHVSDAPCDRHAHAGNVERSGKEQRGIMRARTAFGRWSLCWKDLGDLEVCTEVHSFGYSNDSTSGWSLEVFLSKESQRRHC
jgi:hypothetical protein